MNEQTPSTTMDRTLRNREVILRDAMESVLRGLGGRFLRRAEKPENIPAYVQKGRGRFTIHLVAAAAA
ncbi:MAG: hypothetical protein QXU44_08775 [Candidatus Caldarchaeum sp.]